MSGPYGQAARAYLAAGWTGVLPLPPRAKTPPPAGYTGTTGRDPSGADVWAWTEDHRARGNLALRLPSTLVGIDVDDYAARGGAATLARAAARLGPLPDTWTATSRPGTASGVRLYRVPAGTRLVGALGPGVDVVQHTHRYVVAAPSIHPEGRRYRWSDPDGAVSDLPRPTEVPELPATWLAALTAAPARPRATRTGTRLVRTSHTPALEVLARPGAHHRDWITAQLADHLRQLRRTGHLEHAAAAGFLVGQARALHLDDATDRLAAALARHQRPELVDAATAGHARARAVRWTVSSGPSHPATGRVPAR